MAFILNSASTKKRPLQEKHLEWAGRLIAGLAAATVLAKMPSKKKWAEEFRLLNQMQPDESIEAAVKWVLKNILRIRSREKGVPPVFSAGALRRQVIWDWVQDSIQKEQKAQPRTASKTANRIASNIAQTMHWPKGSKTQLPWIVDQSLKNLDAYVKALRRVNLKKIKTGVSRSRISGQIKSGQADMDPKLRKRYTHDQLVDQAVKGLKESYRRRLKGLRSVIESMFSGGAESFVERWLTQVNKQVRDWKEWSGSLDYYVFSPAHKVWDRMVKERVQEWGGVGAVNLWAKFKGGLDAQV